MSDNDQSALERRIALMKKYPEYFDDEELKVISDDASLFTEGNNPPVDLRTDYEKRGAYEEAVERQKIKNIENNNNKSSANINHSSLYTAWYSYALRKYKGDLNMEERARLYTLLGLTYNSLKKYVGQRGKNIDLSSREILEFVQSRLSNNIYGDAIKGAFLQVRVGQKISQDGFVSGSPIKRLKPLKKNIILPSAPEIL